MVAGVYPEDDPPPVKRLVKEEPPSRLYSMSYVAEPPAPTPEAFTVQFAVKLQYNFNDV
jgi:hypothetical protein